MDLDDLENTLKPLYEEEVSHNLIKDSGYYYHQYLIERNELNLEDNWWNVISSPEEVEFHSLKYDKLTKDLHSDHQSIFK